MTVNIWIFSLEPLDNRYTAQWHYWVPRTLTDMVGQQQLDVRVHQVDGKQNTTKTTAGGFLNFVDTNFWKSSQLCAFLDLHNQGQTTPHDVFLFTDAWNPVILQLRYISDLMGYNWRMHGYWHAGAYDPTDILGLKMNKPWPWHLERSLYYACDKNWFATDFHRRMFLNNLGIMARDEHRSGLSGQPHDAIIAAMNDLPAVANKAGVIWPHRYNSDKQPEIAESLASNMTVPWLLTQKLNLDKQEYYQVLTQHQVLFSCSLHENLGISVMEGVLCDVIPVLPQRCSYQEMYLPEFLYPAKWTANWDQFLAHREQLEDFIMHRINNRERYQSAMNKQKQLLKDRYLQANIMYDNMLQDIVTTAKI
jgi:hypothetical protein